MKLYKKVRSCLYRNSTMLRRIWFHWSFYKNNGYFLSLSNPVTYNEKINLRKSSPNNPLFSVCSDKLAVKGYLAENGFSDIVIDNYFEGTHISVDELQNIINKHGDVLVKANHNSGPVFIAKSEHTPEQLSNICENVNKQLKIDYGLLKDEPWYSEIERKVLVEKRLMPEDGDTDLKDYKFHVFKQADGEYRVILHIDFDRGSIHNRSYFDDELNWLPFFVKYPSLVTQIERPDNYDQMLNIVKALAEPFSYVRVDLYNINGAIYFGELTFAHESGCGAFSHQVYDQWMGKLWAMDPRR